METAENYNEEKGNVEADETLRHPFACFCQHPSTKYQGITWVGVVGAVVVGFLLLFTLWFISFEWKIIDNEKYFGEAAIKPLNSCPESVTLLTGLDA